MPLYKLFSTARSYSLGLVIFLHNRIYFTLTISHIHLQFYVPQVYNLHLYFLGSHLYKYKWFFIFYPQVFHTQNFFSQAYIVPTTRGHYPIIFHTTFFHLTFRDYCGIKLLLGHQYGSHYLHLNLKIMNGTHILNNYIVITSLVKNKKTLLEN